MYKYTGAPFKGASIDDLLPETLEILISWGYIVKTDESNQSQSMDSNAKQQRISLAKSDSRTKRKSDS